MNEPPIEKTSPNRSRYFFAASLLALAVTVVGFFKTFLLPSAVGTFSAPPIVYWHGTFLFLWALLFLVQTTLIRGKNMRFHRLLGFWSSGLVVGIVVSTIGMGVYTMKRDLALGLGETSVSNLVGTTSTSLVFSILVAAGIYYRRRPEIHKRLMVLAMIAILWPAFVRLRYYFPTFPESQLIFGVLLPNSMVLLAAIWEKFTVGSVHRTYLTVGPLLFAEHLAEYYLFDTSGWRVVGNWLAGFFL